MSKLEEALREKIELLREEKEELEDALSRIDSQIEVCEGLLCDEADDARENVPKKRGRPRKTAPKAPAKKRGRPRKKTAPKVDDALLQEYEEARNSLPDGSTGTTPEQQQRAVRRFKPALRNPIAQGGVVVGSTKGKPGTQEPDPAGHSTISMEDDLPEEE
jgi:hypothetical protein